MDAHDILQIVQPFGVIGVSIVDLADPATWGFQGGDVKAARQALVDALAAPPVPDPTTALEARVEALADQFTDLATKVQALAEIAPAPMDTPPLPPTL